MTSLFSTPTHALDADEIYKFDVCKGTSSPFTDKEVDGLLESSRDFPSSYMRLGSYIDYVQTYNDRAQNDRSCPLKGPNLLPPHPVLEALIAVTTGTTAMMAIDIQQQRKLVEKASICSAVWAKKVPKPSEVTTAQASITMFKELTGKSPSPDECVKFVNAFVPELNFRYRRMRQYLVLSDKKQILDYRLSHDRPFTTFIGEKVVKTVWKTDGSISQLTKDEIQELAGLSAALKTDPKSLYSQIVSTSQILLYFTDPPTPKTITEAFQHWQEETSADTISFLKNPPQEIMLYTPYVVEAIKQLPEGQRGEACQAVKEIYKNLKFRYDGVPRLLNIAALAFSVPSPARMIKGGVAKAFGEFAKRAGIGATVVGGYNAVDNLLIYLDGVTMCSRVAMERNMNPEIDGLCSLEKVNGKYEEAQTNAIVSAAFGSAVLSWSRIAKPAMKARTVKNQAVETEKRAAEEIRRSWDDVH